MNNVWPPAPPDRGAVVKAAEALGIREYDFFRLAFRRWNGCEAEEKECERTFVAYMFRQIVPIWVRHFSREVLQLQETGTLEPRAFGIDGYQRRQPLPRLGGFSWRLVAVAILLVLLMSLDTTYVRDPSVSLGCPGASGSMFLDRVAGIFKRGPDTECPEFAVVSTDRRNTLS